MMMLLLLLAGDQDLRLRHQLAQRREEGGHQVPR
jgi:hypothetical protein